MQESSTKVRKLSLRAVDATRMRSELSRNVGLQWARMLGQHN